MANGVYRAIMRQLPPIPPKIGDIQTDTNKTEWVVVGVTHSGLSRVKRYSLAHEIHAQHSPAIAHALIRQGQK